MNQEKEKIAQTLLELIDDYHHYKFMRAGIFSGWYAGMSFADFFQWLKSRNK